jgi:hypothetical protein
VESLLIREFVEVIDEGEEEIAWEGIGDVDLEILASAGIDPNTLSTIHWFGGDMLNEAMFDVVESLWSQSWNLKRGEARVMMMTLRHYVGFVAVATWIFFSSSVTSGTSPRCRLNLQKHQHVCLWSAMQMQAKPLAT